MWQSELCFAQARAGDRTGAAAMLSELVALSQRSYVSPYDLALCYAGFGDNDAALSQLENAYRERVMRIIAIEDPEFDNLRHEQRLVSLANSFACPANFASV